MQSDTPAQAASGAAQASPTPGAVDWAAWLREYGPRIFLFARQQLMVEADAEDVMQESLVQLVRAVEDGSFRGDSSQYAAYVCTVIRHRAMELARREALLRSKYRELHEQDGELAYPEPWLESSLDDAYLRNNVENLLRTLPGIYAEVVILHVWGEYTFRQIADMVGASTSTVSSRFRYALQVLRKKLSSHSDNPLQL